MQSFSVIIPVYCSAGILPKLAQQLHPVLERLNAPYELILVNDASPDNSWNVISALAADCSWITGIDMMRNYGQHNALLAGIAAAHYDIIITMDDDLQHPPEVLPTLIAKLEDGFDVVYGPPVNEQHGLFRNLASQITKLALQGAMGADVARQISALRVFRTSLRKAFLHYSNSYVNIDVLLTWGTTRFAAVPVRHEPRLEGQSGYTIGKLTVHALNMITGFTTLPLQIASWVGFSLALLGGLILLYVIINWIHVGSLVPGFAFITSVIAIFSGAQLFSLGIIGEYLARMHFRIMERPPFTIRETTSD